MTALAYEREMRYSMAGRWMVAAIWPSADDSAER